MSFLWKAIGGVLGAGGIPNFPYSVGPLLDTHRTATLTWTLHQGTRDEDRTPVTIFCCDFSEKSEFSSNTDPAAKDLARNALKRAKLLMLPGLLRCFEAVEHNQTLYIATEECRPLTKILQDDTLRPQYFEGDPDASSSPSSSSSRTNHHSATLLLDIQSESVQDSVALGLKQVGQALIAMHKHQLQHSNVCHESIFVVRSGEWRLFGHEYVGEWTDESSLYRRLWSLLPEYRRPPETLSSAGPFASVSAVDAWGLGSLIFAVFSIVAGKKSESFTSVKTADLRAFRAFPRSLQSGYIGITGANPKLRMTIEKFLSETEFVCGSEFVNSLQQLEELALKDAADRDTLYRNLTNVVDKFPLRACKYLILTKLNHAVTYSGGGSATALEPILKIGARLTDPADFAELVAPVVMALFNSPDRTVRMRLLTSASQYARLLPAPLVNEKIWPLFLTGFSSTDANLREHTVRALVHFAPLLQEKTLTTDALRYITALQQDREGPIRTNATICLCLIAAHLPESARSKALVHGFGRMLKDPFLPSRISALKSISTTLSFVTPPHLAELLLPAVIPLTLDVALEVREKAIEVVEGSLNILKQASAEMTEKQPAAATTSSGSEGLVAAGTPVIPTSASSSSSFLGQWGWGASSDAAPAAATPVTKNNNASVAPRSSSAANYEPPSAPVSSPAPAAASRSTVPTTTGASFASSSSSFAAPVVATTPIAKPNPIPKRVDPTISASTAAAPATSSGWDEEDLGDDDWGTATTAAGGAPKKGLTLGTKTSSFGSGGANTTASSSVGGATAVLKKKKGFGGATKAD